MKQLIAFLMIVADLAAIGNPFPGRLDIRGSLFSVRDLRTAEVTADVYVTAPVNLTVLGVRVRRATIGGMPCEVTIPKQRRVLRRGIPAIAAKGVKAAIPIAGLKSLSAIYSLVFRGSVELQGDIELDVETVQSIGGAVLRGQGTFRTHFSTAVDLVEAIQ